MLRTAIVSLALASVLSAQFYSLQFPSGAVPTALLWNGRPALAIASPSGIPLAQFLRPAPGTITIELDVQMVAVLDSRPCAVGSRWDFSYDDWHSPSRLLGPGGISFASPWGRIGYVNVAMHPDVTWSVSYCAMEAGCYGGCGPFHRRPEWTLVVAYVVVK